MSFRIGTVFNGIWVSTTVVLQTAPVWLIIAALGSLVYTFIYRFDDLHWWFITGYLVLFSLLPSAMLILTLISGIVMGGIWLHFHWGWF